MSDQVAIDYEKLADQLLARASVSSKGVSSTPSAQIGHGPGGLFSAPGLSRPVFSSLILPSLGLMSRLPALPSNDTNPLWGIMTGVTASTGSNPVGVCDDPPYAGLMKMCEHQFVFGRLSRMTRVIDLDTSSKRFNRSDFTDLQLMNNPFGLGGLSQSPTIPGSDVRNALNSEVAKNLFEFAAAWGRDFTGLTYTGNPTNNTAGGGYKEWYGLDILINTGYKDAETGTACPGADSIVRSFANAEVKTNGALLVRTITNMYRNLRFIASRTGLDPATWTICMPWSLFYEITEIWPCAYMTYRCQSTNTVDATQPGIINQSDMIAMRDSMRGDIFNRSGQYLLIDGQRVDVTIDDGIAETVVAGMSYRASIYFVPLTVLGGTPVTYWEYFNYDGPNGPLEAAKILAPTDSYFTSDGGRFLWHKKPPTNFCVQMLAKTEPRVMLVTPMIAARLTGVQYTPLAHQRDFDPSASYYSDGGKTGRDFYGPSYYAPN
jgi:hypothetical protein